MVVGENFVWVHFPKCGGHTVESALRRAMRGSRDVAFDKRWPFHPGWHDTPADRSRRDQGFDPHGKIVISGIRRLPSWLLSRIHYEASRPPYHCATREMFSRGRFFEQNGSVGWADEHVERFVASGVQRWIRLEHLAEDFARHFSDLLGRRTEAAAGKLRRVLNPTEIQYLKRLDFYFTPREIDALYAANPAWAAVERQVYGDTLRL